MTKVHRFVFVMFALAAMIVGFQVHPVGANSRLNAATAVPRRTTVPTAKPQPTAVPTAMPAPLRGDLTVFAAASLVDAFKEIGQNFEEANPGVNVTFNFAGSQQLAQQLGQGAPADVFASANATQLKVAVDAGRVADGTSRVFVKNRLVVVTPNTGTKVNTLQDLATPGLKLVFAAKAVPVGQYTLDFLNKAASDPAFGANYPSNVLANVVSYEDNVRSVLAKVALGEADAGVVYVSDVIANPKNPISRIEIPSSLNVIASYPVAKVSDSPNAALAQKFIDYLSKGGPQVILLKNGFSLP